MIPMLETHSDNTISVSAEIRIEFHADIRNVLRLALLDVYSLHTLRYHPKAAVTRLLESEIKERIIAVHEEDEHLGTKLDFIM